MIQKRLLLFFILFISFNVHSDLLNNQIISNSPIKASDLNTKFNNINSLRNSLGLSNLNFQSFNSGEIIDKQEIIDNFNLISEISIDTSILGLVINSNDLNLLFDEVTNQLNNLSITMSFQTTGGGTTSLNVQTITKTSGNNWNTFVESINELVSGDGFVEFRTLTNGDMTVGFRNPSNLYDNIRMNYGFYNDSNGNRYAVEDSNAFVTPNVLPFSSDNTSIFKIAIESGEIKLYKDNVLVHNYTNDSPIQYPLRFYFSIYTTNQGVEIINTSFFRSSRGVGFITH